MSPRRGPKKAPVVSRYERQQKARREADLKRISARPEVEISTVQQPLAPERLTFYVDIAAVRIQTWLDRTPKLTHRRGGSYVLEEATSASSIKDLCARLSGSTLPDDLVVNEQAGDISGVVSLCFTAADDVEADVMARAVAGEVAGHLRGEVPAVPLQGWVGTGRRYLDAYSTGRHVHREKFGSLLDLPAPQDDFCAAKPCAMCGLAAAQQDAVDASGQPVCLDCRARAAHAGSNRSPADVPRSSRLLLADMEVSTANATPAVNGTGPTLSPAELRIPEDFDDLAKLGRRSHDDEPTQLATIFADGNQIGRLLAEVAVKDPAPTGTDDIVQLLDRVTKAAVTKSVTDMMAGATRNDWQHTIPITLHLAGGDDVLATVPAPLGWIFATGLAKNFETASSTGRLIKTIKKSLNAILHSEISVSSAIIFHHRAAPFSDVVARAEELLVETKKMNAGKAAAIGFLDLTDDGGELGASSAGLRPTHHDRCLPVADIPGHNLNAMAEVAASQRQTLRDLLRQQPTSADTMATWRETLTHRVQVMDIDAIKTSIIGGARGANGPAHVLIGQDDADGERARRRLRRDLDIARWWLSPQQLQDLKMLAPVKDPHR